MGSVLPLAQAVPTENPFGYGAVGLLLAICIWLIWTFIQDIRIQRDRLQQALDLQREATLTALDASRVNADGMRELKELGRLLRRVLEALPQTEDDTPEPRPPTGRRR